MINFCHISPTAHLEELTATNGAHLLLAHLVESDERYRDYYATLNDGKMKILDNSAFEMYKQRRPMYPSDKLIEMGKAVNADVIVLSDYPGEVCDKTIAAAIKLAPEIRAAGFKTFFVPQGEVGALDQYIQSFRFAVNSHLVDMIGVSILGVPNAFGVERGNRLQRYMSRFHMMNILEREGLLATLQKTGMPKRLHFLGMVDGPNEIKLMEPYHKYIYSWDSSAAVWAGLNQIIFDNSPTGLRDGKFEKEVDFNFVGDFRAKVGAKRNIEVIDQLARGGRDIHVRPSTKL